MITFFEKEKKIPLSSKLCNSQLILSPFEFLYIYIIRQFFRNSLITFLQKEKKNLTFLESLPWFLHGWFSSSDIIRDKWRSYRVTKIGVDRNGGPRFVFHLLWNIEEYPREGFARTERSRGHIHKCIIQGAGLARRRARLLHLRYFHKIKLACDARGYEV